MPQPSQSLSAIERANPPPRRKSCAGCIKAKRRCTLETPACQRCSQRQLACEYPQGVTRKKRPLPPSPPPPPAETAPCDHTIAHTRAEQSIPDALHMSLSLAASSYGSPSFHNHMTWDSPTDPESTISTSTPSTANSSPPTLNDHAPSLLDFVIDVQEDQHCPEAGHDVFLSSTQLSCLDMTDLMTTTPKADSSGGISSWELLRNGSHEDPVEAAIKTRLQYAIERLRETPRQFVVETRTPWSHRRLYEHSMPASIEDAHAACALYMAKNADNSQIIMRSIENRVQRLVSKPMPSEPLELLARTHALILYQIMRLFDQDMRIQSAAQGTQTHLEAAAMRLVEHTVFERGAFDDMFVPAPDAVAPNETGVPSLPLYPLDETRAFWRDWIFQESARRTFLICVFFLQASRLLAGSRSLTCDSKMILCHSFTLSAYLWDADDPLSFAIAWKEKKHLVVKNSNVADALVEAKCDDIDVFGKIVLTTILGIDTTKGWLLTKGGAL